MPNEFETVPLTDILELNNIIAMKIYKFEPYN